MTMGTGVGADPAKTKKGGVGEDRSSPPKRKTGDYERRPGRGGAALYMGTRL